MRRRTVGFFTISVLILFAIGILFVGQEYSSSSKLVSVRIGGVLDQQSEKHVQELMKMIKGVETVIFDQDARLCTFRYDSSIIDYRAIEAQFTALGFLITPITQVDLTARKSRPADQKLFQIRFSSNQ